MQKCISLSICFERRCIFLKKKLIDFVFGIRSAKLEKEDESLLNMYKTLLIIAWPAAFEGLLMSLMNSFDTMMVGSLGPEAIAAVGLCAQPRMILLLIAQALCVGTTAIVARRKGANDHAAAVSCMKQSLVIISIIGVIMVISGVFFAKPLLYLSGAKEDTIGYAVTYFKITSLTYLFNCWALCICAAMRGIGKTRLTMVVNMTANIVNVFLNYCLIGGHFGFPALGVKGAAIATAIGTIASAIMAIVMILPKDAYLSIRPFNEFSFDKETLAGLIKIGAGSIAEAVFMRIGFLINGRLIADVSTAAYATNQVVQQVSSLSFTLGDGVSSACTSLVGQSLGAVRKDKAMVYVKVGQRISLFLSIGLILLLFFGRNIFPPLFTDDPQIIAMASLSFLVITIGIYPQNIRVMLAGCLRGAGDVKFVAFVSLVSVAVLRPVLTWLFCYPLNDMFPSMNFGFTGSWISFNIDAFVRAAMLVWRVNKGKWVNIKV